jgi:hypothetical protein
MLAEKRESRLAVIEAISALGPMNKLEVPPNVLAMALHTIAAFLGEIRDSCVVTLCGFDAGPDLSVTFRAFEDRLTGAESVARCALSWAVKGAMCCGQWPGGQLGLQFTSSEPAKEKHEHEGARAEIPN